MTPVRQRIRKLVDEFIAEELFDRVGEDDITSGVEQTWIVEYPSKVHL